MVALQGPFSALVDKHVTDPWLRNFIDLECFVLSGMTARDTIAAQMAFMYEERGAGRSSIDYPVRVLCYAQAMLCCVVGL